MSDQPKDFTAAEWLEQAEEAEDSDNTKTALEAVEKALKLDPSLGEAWRLKASLLQDMDQPQEAFRVLSEACQRLPHDAGCWFDLGAFLATHNNLPQALDCYMRCYNIDSDFPRIKTTLGMAFKDMHDFENAVRLLTDALEENHTDIDKSRVLNRLAEAHIVLEHFDQAYECLDKALVLDESNFIALANMAMVHLQRQEKEAARSAIQSAIDKAPKNANLYIMKAAIYDDSADKEDRGEADKAIEKALQLAPEDPEIWIKVANRYLHYQDIAKVINSLDKAVEAAPDSYQTWHSRAFLLSQVPEESEECLRSFDRSIDLNPFFPGNWLMKAQVLHKLGRIKEATACHRRGLHLTGSLIIWGVFLIDENNVPVEGSQVAIETERSIPQTKIVEQYVERLKKEGHTIDEEGKVDNKYRIAMTQVPLDQVEDKPVYKDGEEPPKNIKEQAKKSEKPGKKNTKKSKSTSEK